MRKITEHCQRRKKQLIVCDVNAHHILWGSTGTNPRGESLVEFLVTTFVVCNRKEVTDLTLRTIKIGDLANKWHVSDEPPLSDHRYICFQIGNITNYVTFRNPKRTKWESYKVDLRGNLEIISGKIRMINNIDRSVNQLQ
jgi:hypothetical protein